LLTPTRLLEKAYSFAVAKAPFALLRRFILLAAR